MYDSMESENENEGAYTTCAVYKWKYHTSGDLWTMRKKILQLLNFKKSIKELIDIFISD